MKSTYLIFEDVVNGNQTLRTATAEEWNAILQYNRTAPKEQRRYFIRDSFDDCGKLDCMFIEVTREKYEEWHREQSAKYRNRKSKAAYLHISLDAANLNRHDGIKTDVKALSVNDVFDLWCNLKRGVKDSTMKNYIYMYEMFVRPTFGKKRLVTVKKSDVRGFYNRLADEKILKISTIDGIHNVLHQVFQVAVDDDYIRNNPTDNMLKELKQAHCMDSEKRKALTMEEEKIFLEYLMQKPKYRHWYPVFYIMANTGMRVGEITGLRWRDIDFDEGLISVNHTLVYYNHRDEHGCYYSINTPKTKAGERTIPMTDQVKNAFQMEREYQEEVGISSIDRIDGYDDFVFVNRFGMVQSQSTLNKAIKRIMRDCNGEILDNAVPGKEPTLLPDFSCHSLRHTFATRLCESGTNIKVIQDVLGHADVSTTMNIYVDVTNELKKNELKSFSAYMEGA